MSSIKSTAFNIIIFISTFACGSEPLNKRSLSVTDLSKASKQSDRVTGQVFFALGEEFTAKGVEVAKISLISTKSNIIINKELDLSEETSLGLEDIPVGMYTLKIELIGKGSKLLFSGISEIRIETDRIAVAKIELQGEVLAINVEHMDSGSMEVLIGAKSSDPDTSIPDTQHPLWSSLVPSTPNASQFFVAPNGKSTNRGSEDSPWDLQTALNHPTTVKPGDVIWVRGGTYSGLFESLLLGKATAPIIVRSYPGERVILDAYPNDGATLAVYKGAYTWFWGLEITNGWRDTPPAWRETGRAESVYVKAPGTKLINMVAHNTDMGFAIWSEAAHSELYGSLSFYHGYENRQHGSYQQNKTGDRLVRDNVMFWNAGFGFQAAGSSNAYIDNFYLEGNVVFNNGILYKPDHGVNILVGIYSGSKPLNNLSLTSNYTYTDPKAKVSKNQMGYTGGCTGTNLRSNIFSASNDRALTLAGGCLPDAMTDNTFIGNTDGFDPASYGKNSYIKNLSELSGRKPTVKVRPNLYEPGRAMVVVYNWQNHATVSLDLSQTDIAFGDTYEIRDVENIFGKPIVSAVFDGKPVTLPMTQMEVMQPTAKVSFPPSHSPLGFGTFLVLRQKSYATSELAAP